jgi:predicted alpha/beta hydrolase family esterase
MMTTALMVPGLWSSGPEHWQTLWERHEPRFRRVQQGLGRAGAP